MLVADTVHTYMDLEYYKNPENLKIFGGSAPVFYTQK